MNVLEIKNLRISYQLNKSEFESLKGVNLEIKKGEFIGVVGESGSGKSTLARGIVNMLANNSNVKSGEIKYYDKNLLKLNKKDMRKVKGNKIGIIFQDSMNSLNPLRKIKSQFIELFKEKKGLSKEEAYQKSILLLKSVNLRNVNDVMNKFPFQLSGGQKQRICIAMAFALEPDLLIADEPTTALDVTVQAQILSLMNKLRLKNQTSMIFISHDLGVVSQLCDKVAVMYNGEIVEYAKTDDVIMSPKHDYTKSLIRCIPNLEKDKSKVILKNEVV